MEFPEIKMGLKRPATVEEQMKIASDIGAMRKAITRGQRDSALIQRCLMIGEANGLSGEETLVVLAYNALCELETSWRMRLELSALNIHRPVMHVEGDSP